jgi:signal transduction histidine kinase
MMTDWMQVLLLGLVGAAAAAVPGAVVLRSVRRRSLRMAMLVVALTAAASILGGVLLSARSMFLSDHDLGVLLLVTLPATLVAVGVAVLLGRNTATDVQLLVDSATSLEVMREVPTRKVRHADLRRVADQLDETRGRLHAAQERERALERSRRELVAWVSHDLRTPLAGLRAMTEALEDGVVTDEPTVAKYHHRMREETDRLADMVDDLFELSRVQADVVQRTLSTVPLADLVSDAVAAADPVARAKRIHLKGEALTSAALAVDVPEVSRVLGNLLLNAIRHTPHDATIHVIAGADDRWAWVEVADTCGGIPEQDLPRVFDVGFRGTSARTPERGGVAPGGAGLGLAIARGIVEAHSGEIDVVNVGDGCRFRVRLPLTVA